MSPESNVSGSVRERVTYIDVRQQTKNSVRFLHNYIHMYIQLRITLMYTLQNTLSVLASDMAVGSLIVALVILENKTTGEAKK